LGLLADILSAEEIAGSDDLLVELLCIYGTEQLKRVEHDPTSINLSTGFIEATALVPPATQT
jgi:hypothetical protein